MASVEIGAGPAFAGTILIEDPPQSAAHFGGWSATIIRATRVASMVVRIVRKLQIRLTSSPGRHFRAGKHDPPGLVRFRKHHRPCGQPAVEGGMELFLPVPAHAGHFIRIKATPSALPFRSTGLARYPEPPQRGQSFGSTRPPLLQ
jgi:hypothetical protein